MLLDRPRRNGSPIRLAVVASHPIQYFTPIYQRLGARDDISLEVFYCSDFGTKPSYDAQFQRRIAWDTDLLSGYSSRILRSISPFRNTFNPAHAINPSLLVHMLRGFDAVWVNGYLYPSNYLAVLSGALQRTKVLFRSELAIDQRRKRRWFDPLRDRVLCRWIRGADALLYIGQRNRQAYLQVGANADKLHFCPYCVDIHALALAVGTVNRSNERAALGIPDHAIVILMAGKLTQRKHPEALLQVCKNLADLNVHGVFAGSGPLESQLKAQADSMRLTNVSFLGFVNQSRLPTVYAIADVFLFVPENEPWGLVLNEACAAGLPSVVTGAVGAAEDLVVDGRSGFVVSPRDELAMLDRVRQLVINESLRRSMGFAATKLVSGYSFDAAANGVMGALHSVV